MVLRIFRSTRYSEEETETVKIYGQRNYRPNAAEPLSDEDIDLFYNRGVLGIQSQRALPNTVWLNNCIYYEAWTRAEGSVLG